MPRAFDFDEDFIDVEGIAIPAVTALQTPGVLGTELDAPEPDRLPADGDAALS